ncbi:hypothetical protein BBP40_006806, partial [Aspergillus hancockii]
MNLILVLLLLTPVCLGLPVTTLGSSLSAGKQVRVEAVGEVKASGKLLYEGLFTRRILSTFLKGQLDRDGGSQPQNKKQLRLPVQPPTSSNRNVYNNKNNYNNNHHGIFLSTNMDTDTNTDINTTQSKTRYLRVLRATQFPGTMLRRYAHEIVVVGLFLLVPVTLAVVEVLERVGSG